MFPKTVRHETGGIRKREKRRIKTNQKSFPKNKNPVSPFQRNRIHDERVVLFQSIIILLHFEISLRMQTCRTYFRSFRTYINVTAVTALPYSFFAFLNTVPSSTFFNKARYLSSCPFSASAILRYIVAIAGKPS